MPGPRELQGTSCDKDGRAGSLTGGLVLSHCHTVPSPAAGTEGPRGYTELPAERSWLSFMSSVNSSGNLFSLTKYGFIHPSAVKAEPL